MTHTRMTDAQWFRIRSFLDTGSGRKDAHGRLCVEALRGMTRRGAPWRAWPPAYGKGNSVYGRYAAWCNQGVWPRLRAHLQTQPDVSAVWLDSPIVRMHVSAAGAPKKKGTDPARGRSRGGFGTQIHILADLRGRPLSLRVTGGQRHDRTQAQTWVEDGTDAPLPCLIADRAYDSDGFRAWWAQRGIEAVTKGQIPRSAAAGAVSVRKSICCQIGAVVP